MSEGDPRGKNDQPKPREPGAGTGQLRPSEQGTLEEAGATQAKSLRENIPGRKGDEPPQETADRLEEQKYVPVPKPPQEKPSEKPIKGRGRPGLTGIGKKKRKSSGQ